MNMFPIKTECTALSLYISYSYIMSSLKIESTLLSLSTRVSLTLMILEY